MEPVFLAYSQAELDDCYDQRVWARDAAAAVARLGTTSAAIRAATPHAADLAYGTGPEERLDWFHPNTPFGTPGGPIHIHIHGGAWRNLTKHDASFAAAAFTEAGIHHVVPNFSKLPARRLPDVVAELAGAVAWIHQNASAHGADPSRILLSGHSSGAHLAAVLLTQGPKNLIKAALLVSGIYDLAPVLLSARGSYVTLTPEEIDALSPARHAAAITCPVTLVHGTRESPEFQRQTQDFATSLAAAGRLAHSITIAEADHFDVNEAFAHREGPVHRAAIDALLAMPKAKEPPNAA